VKPSLLSAARPSTTTTATPQPTTAGKRGAQSPRSSKKSDYSGSSLLSENRREVLDFTSSRKRSEQEKELELERAKAKAGAGKDNGVSLHEVKPVPTTTAATINVVTMPSHQHESTVIQPLPEKQQHQPPAQEALEIEGIVIKI